MTKQVNVHDLQKGMYVSELDRPWAGTPFLFQGFEIRSDEQIIQLQQFCQYVYIDTNLGQTSRSAHRTAGQLNTPSPPSTALTHAEILKLPLRQVIALPRYIDLTTLEEEMPVARTIEIGMRELVYSIMDDVRLGHSVDSQRVRVMIVDMVDSITRNPDALVWLTQLRIKDEYTALHSVRVAIIALAFGRHLNLSVEDLNVLGIGALLHDIGKLKIPNEIINKPGQLTPQEYKIVKMHVPHGVEILESSSGIPRAAIDVARCHHERYAGTGYAAGLSGDRIGLFGLIGAIVDTYDAITSDRAYRAGISAYVALTNLYRGRNKDYHGELVDQFIQCMGVYPIGSIVEMNTGSIGVVITVNRHRRLRPRISLVFDENKEPYPHGTILDLAHVATNENGRPIEIRRVLAAGTNGIDPSSYLPTGP
ncbi:MAG TPA: HD-GYP domain-containing protein [Acidiferrobacter sp.]|nr:HD-GYP domain-containing protein [Acidiferrobacter sp.]